MANLLNVSQQVSNKAAPSLESPSASKGLKNPAKMEGNDLKDLFQKKLSENLAGATDISEAPEATVDPTVDLGAAALAAGVNAPKAAAIDLKKPGTNEAPAKAFAEAVNTKIETVKAEPKGIQIPNQLNAKNVKIDPKLLAAQAAVLKNAEAVSANPAINQALNAELATAVSGEDLTNLHGEFDVESFDLKNSDAVAGAPKEASSKLSTADFLNLREISQNPAKVNLMSAATPALTDAVKLAPLPATTAVVMGMKPTQKQKGADGKEDLSGAMNGLAPAHGDKAVFGKMMDATVSQTDGQKPVLSQESINQIGNQVNLLGQARQDGEIKIRLRPDHLGELQMKVITQGQNVTVQIKAANDEAKKIIEDSLGSLRETLSAQNLSLARIDVVTQPNPTQDQAAMNFDANQNFNQSSANGERGMQDGSGQSRRDFFRDDQGFGGAPAPTMIRPRSSTANSTRLDLIA